MYLLTVGTSRGSKFFGNHLFFSTRLHGVILQKTAVFARTGSHSATAADSSLVGFHAVFIGKEYVIRVILQYIVTIYQQTRRYVPGNWYHQHTLRTSELNIWSLKFSFIIFKNFSCFVTQNTLRLRCTCRPVNYVRHSTICKIHIKLINNLREELQSSWFQASAAV